MRIENALRWIAIGCAIFLLFGPLADRTTLRSGNTTMTDAAGYNVAAFFSGIVAIVGLAVALWVRPHVILPVLGAVLAIAAFGLTVFASGIYWLARTRGEVYLYGFGEFARDNGKVDPASGPPFFALAAIIGALASLALAVSWLRQPRRA